MSSLTISEVQGQLVVDSRLVADELGVEHESFMRTVKKYETKIEQRFGCIRFEIGVPLTPTGNPPKFAWLTEDQATALMTFSKNTDQVIECKLNLVEAFSKAKEIIKTVIPAQADRIRELELELQLTQAQTQKAIADKAVLDTRHLIVTTCPEPIQQKILGYEVVKEVEYRDRVILNDEIIDNGDTISKTELCKRYGILTKCGKPDYKKFNQILESIGGLKGELWKPVPIVRDNMEFRREYLNELDALLERRTRQLWIGE